MNMKYDFNLLIHIYLNVQQFILNIFILFILY